MVHGPEACVITPGLSQGSALSPVLFNVYTVGITSNQLEGPGRTLSFADDGLVSRIGKVRQLQTVHKRSWTESASGVTTTTAKSTQGRLALYGAL